MKNLIKYIEDINRWRKFGSKPAISMPLDQDEINEIAGQIDCQMSPENLHCDGEISVAEANRKFRYLNKVFKELEEHARSQGSGITVETYEI